MVSGDSFTAPERMAMVEQLTVPSRNGQDNLRTSLKGFTVNFEGRFLLAPPLWQLYYSFWPHS